MSLLRQMRKGLLSDFGQRDYAGETISPCEISLCAASTDFWRSVDRELRGLLMLRHVQTYKVLVKR